MEIRKVSALRGPNIWASFPVLEALVDLGELKDAASNELAGFNDRLMGWLPSMIEHRCSVGERGGFFERLRRGTYLAHILEHVSLELQCLAGCSVGFGRARETATEGVYKVVVRYREEDVGRSALETGRRLCLAAVHDQPFDVTGEVKQLRDLLHEAQLGPSTRSVVDASTDRDIPHRRLNSGSLVQLGWGARQRRIWTAETDRTSAIAESIAQDKELTRRLLAAIGVPVPEGRPVTDAEDAWQAAQALGGPVVVKPQCGNQGRGVTTNLATREQVVKAYEAARAEERTVLVERYAPGDDYRLLVIGDRLVAAARREAAQVVGDGVHTVAQLIEIANDDPRRGDDHATSLSKMRLDPIALTVLAEQGLSPEAVPPAGARVLIRRNANLSTGGTATDVTERVHPRVAAVAVEAARMVGLDIAGIDVVACDIGRPLDEQGGVVVEVNAGPGLRMHLEPSSGKGQPVGEAIVDMMFPSGETGRIPVVAITGTNGKTTTTRAIAHILQADGRHVGMTCTEGIYIDRRRIETGDCSGPQSARTVLLNPKVEAAVFEIARGGVLREGLGFDRCDVAVVTNIGEGDHLGLGGIETPEQMAEVKSTVVAAVREGGWAVLKADDPLTAAMTSQCRGSAIFFATDGEHPVMRQHRDAGGRVAFVQGKNLVLAEGNHVVCEIPVASIPITRQGRVRFMTENALAAAAATWGLGLSPDRIRGGLQTFSSDPDMVPGRFNVLSLGGATVILDYGHNVSALEALIEAIGTFPHERRSVVYSAAGDRRDRDMVRQGQILGDAFDTVRLYEDQYTRGRADGEIMRLIRAGLDAGSRVKAIEDFHGATRSVEAALDALRPGDLLLVQADVIEVTLDFVREYLAAHPALTGEAIEADAMDDEPLCAPRPAMSMERAAAFSGSGPKAA
ncbi:MAG: cyanophycin synthetase [Planctomycetia bacterium]|nr:cyanophycin synthetase [Planctomycetia bacterium]